MTAVIWRNRIAEILDNKGLSISDFQKIVKLSYPSTHRLVTSRVITDDTKAGTLRRVSQALGVGVAELFEEVEE